MLYIGKVLSNVRQMYNDINSATLTGAIDVVVVEQPDGTFTCSPFHVRFGKLGVLRSREKVVDIEVNGEPLDIHMKLGESGEAFFVEEVPRSELEACPAYLACSPIPSEGEQLLLAKYGNTSPSSPESPPSEVKIREIFPQPPLSPLQESTQESTELKTPRTFRAETVTESKEVEFRPIQASEESNGDPNNAQAPGMSKNARRKKRRKSMHKKKQLQKKSSPGNGEDEDETTDGGAQHSRSTTPPPANVNVPSLEDTQFAMEDVTTPAEPHRCTLHLGGIMLSGEDNSAQLTYSRDCNECARRCSEIGLATVAEASSSVAIQDEVRTKPTDLHFFSDTETSPGHSVGDSRHECLAPDLCDPYWAECSVLAPVTSSNPTTPHGSRSGTPQPQSDSELELQRQSSATEQSQLEAKIQAELGVDGKRSWKWGELPSPPPTLARLHSTGPATEEPTEQEEQPTQQQQKPRSSMLSGVWSLMRSQNRQRAASQQEQGVYLDELNVDTLDPEVAALYFPHSYRGGYRSSTNDTSNRKSSRPSLTESGSREEEDAESGKGPSLSQSPHSVEGAIGGPKMLDSDFEDRTPERKMFPDLALSLCGPLDLLQPPSEEAFEAALVSHEEFRQQPALLEHPALIVRLHGRYQTWREAAPEVLSQLLFQQPLVLQEPPSQSEQKVEISAPEVEAESQIDTPVQVEEAEHDKSLLDIPANTTNSPNSPAETSQGYSWFPWRRSGSVSKKPEPVGTSTPNSSNPQPVGGYRSSDEDELTEITRNNKTENQTKEGEGYSGSNSSDESETGGGINIPGARLRLFEDGEIMYRKTLRLSSEQIASLMLKEGANEVVFSVTTAYQGTSRCKCHVYRWRWDDKIVISDIDGTITKSDVLGHILPIVGKDWAQSGVAQLFTKIKNNGYRLLYLSARAIGQARVTREYLKSIKQGDLSLPEGPLLLSPTSLISALHREVIEKKPEEFKISCLRDIQALFPTECKPFYAGYGNKINDVWAYRAVGIPIFRIFTINHKGELKHELTQTFQTSYFGQSDAVDELFPPVKSTEYSNMSYIVDQMFPPPPEDTSATEDYNSFNYWRDPIPELDPSLIPPTPSSPTGKGGKTPVKESVTVNAIAK